MRMDIAKSDLLELINAQLQNQGDPELPANTEISVHVPGGGDYSNTDLELDDREVKLTLRWKV